MAKPDSKSNAPAITPRASDYGQWYLDVVREGDLADHSSVRGCMVIKPHGYAIWEKLQRALDDRFKATGHQNAYFPLFIPLSLLAKEEEHAAGFAKECAVVTHYRLKAIDGKVDVDPESKLEEPLVVLLAGSPPLERNRAEPRHRRGEGRGLLVRDGAGAHCLAERRRDKPNAVARNRHKRRRGLGLGGGGGLLLFGRGLRIAPEAQLLFRGRRG